MKIRVLHAIDHLGYGGAPFVVKGIVERMPADRVESLVCALRPNPRPLPIRAEVITLGCGKYSPVAVAALARLCRERGVDIVHAHLQKAVLSSLLAAPRGVGRLILHEHGPIFRGGTGCIYRGLLGLLGRRADAIIANSEAVKAALTRTLRGGQVPITVIPNFIDTTQFDPDRYDRDHIREALGVSPDEFVIGFVGRLDRAKGADLLVEAAPLLPGPGAARRVLVVGAGPERKDLERRIRRLGLGRTVVLAGLHENPAMLMRAFDVGVVPSRREAFGIAALEMMRMKLPVIVSPVGGLPELVRDGRTGIVLAELSAAALAEAIQRLEQDVALRETLSRNACAHAASFDGPEQVAQLMDIYIRVMATEGHESGT
jgi:glycosyltransferase involved in cell wall biosynthesis